MVHLFISFNYDILFSISCFDRRFDIKTPFASSFELLTFGFFDLTNLGPAAYGFVASAGAYCGTTNLKAWKPTYPSTPRQQQHVIAKRTTTPAIS